MKIRIRENKNKESAQYLLYLILKNSLIIVHPFMPFITESVWQSLPEIKGEKRENDFDRKMAYFSLILSLGTSLILAFCRFIFG